MSLEPQGSQSFELPPDGPLHELDLRLEPGDVMVVTTDVTSATGSNTAVVTASISGLEE